MTYAGSNTYMLLLWSALCAACAGYPQIPNVPSAGNIMGGWYETVIEVDETCLAMDTWQKVIMAFVKESFSSHTCPVQRYVSPVPFLRVVMDGLLGWSSFDPDPAGGNCVAPEGEVLCMWLNFYLVLLHLVIPLMILHAFIAAYHDLIMLLLHGTYHLCAALCREIHTLEHAYEDRRYVRSQTVA